MGENGELSKLKNLRGHLTIKFRSNKVTTESGAAQCLKDKKDHLESLYFDWDDAEEETMDNAKEAFESFEPLHNIKSI